MGFDVDNAETKRIDLSSHENSAFEVTGLVKHYPAGFVIPYHSHKRCHLLYSQQGVMAVEGRGELRALDRAAYHRSLAAAGGRTSAGHAEQHLRLRDFCR